MGNNLQLPQFSHRSHLITFWNVIGGLLKHQKGGERNDLGWGFLCLQKLSYESNVFLLTDEH